MIKDSIGEHSLFCDESGNSGANLNDKNQPFYVLAGWLVKDEEINDAEKKLTDFKTEFYPGKVELKSVEMLKSSKGKTNANNLIRIMGSVGAPFFIIAEKRFVIAAKIVETFLDPEYNDNVGSIYTWNNIEKKRISNLIYTNCIQTIELFGNSYKEPNLENYSHSLELLIKELNNSSNNDLAILFSGSYRYLEKIVEIEKELIDEYPKKTMRSLNLTVFITFIQLIEKFSLNVGIESAKLIHDATQQFEETLPEAFKLYAKEKDENLAFVLEDGQIILSTLQCLKSINFSDSIDSKIIQAADILAGFLNMYLTRLMSDRQLSNQLMEMGEFFVGSLLANDEFEGSGFCDVIASDFFFEKLNSKIGLKNL